jgi:hypothetical protein
MGIKFTVPNLYLLVVFVMTFNAVQYWPIPGIVIISMAIGILLPFSTNKKFFSTNLVGWLFLYVLIVWLNNVAGDAYLSNTMMLLHSFMGLYVSFSLTYYVYEKGDVNLQQWVIFILIFILLWTTIATYIFDKEFPGIVRLLYRQKVKGGDEVVVIPKFFYMMGLSSYSQPHALPILIPAFVMGLRNSNAKKLIRLAMAIGLVSCMMLLYFSGASGALTVGVMILICSLLVTKGSTTKNLFRLMFVLLLFLPFILEAPFVLGLLDWLDGLVGDESFFHVKIMDIEDTIIYGDASGDVEARQGKYDKTLDAIVDNLMIGTNEGSGGHSALFDRLASLGLVGFIPLITMMILQIKYAVKHIDRQYLFYYYLGVLAAFLMITTKNIAGWDTWFFLFTALPFMVDLNSKGFPSFSKRTKKHHN